MLRRSVRSFVVVFALLIGAILTSACTGGTERTPGITSSITLTSPTPTPVVNVSGDDFQSVVISASPERSPAPVEVSPDASWSARSWVWCKPGLMFGVVFVRDDGQKLADNTFINCEGDAFRDIGLGPGRISQRQRLMDFARDHVLTAEYGTVRSGDNWTQSDNVRVWQNSLGIRFRVMM